MAGSHCIDLARNADEYGSLSCLNLLLHVFKNIFQLVFLKQHRANLNLAPRCTALSFLCLPCFDGPFQNQKSRPSISKDEKKKSETALLFGFATKVETE